MRWWALSIFVALAGSSHLDCQQSSKVSYDGQRVAAVELIANPKISVDSLRPLVQKKPDEAYPPPKVEGTISALKQTGRFTKVEVAVKPDPGGLQTHMLADGENGRWFVPLARFRDINRGQEIPDARREAELPE